MTYYISIVYYNWLVFEEAGWRNKRMKLWRERMKVIYENCVVQKNFGRLIHNSEPSSWRKRKYLMRHSFLIAHISFVQILLLYLNGNITRGFCWQFVVFEYNSVLDLFPNIQITELRCWLYTALELEFKRNCKHLNCAQTILPNINKVI